jgi:hypothetical protein
MSIHPSLLDYARRSAGTEAHVDESSLRSIQQAGSGCRIPRDDRRMRVIEVVAVTRGNQREQWMQSGNEFDAGRGPAAVMRHL